MSTLKKLEIKKKLLAADLLQATLLVVVLAVTLVSLRSLAGTIETLISVRMPNLHDLATVNEAHTDATQAVEALANPVYQGEVRAALYRQADAAFQRLDASWRAFDGRAKSERAAKLFEGMKGPWAAWRSAADEALAAERAVDAAGPGDAAAQARLRAALLAHRQADEASDSQIAEILGWVDQVAKSEADGALASDRDAAVAIAALLVLALAALFVVGFFVVKDVQRVFDTVAGHTARLARGELPEDLTEERGRDFNQIRDGLNAVTGALRRLLDGMNRMSAEHEQGDIDVRVDAARFQGAYRTVAEGVNGMVASHIAVKKQALAVVAELGRGNVEAPLPPLPGKRRFINETVEQVRGNLTGLIDEMNRMSSEHERGEIDAVIDVARFEGAYRRMAEGINGMVTSHIQAKRLAMGVVEEFGLGHFDAPMPLLPGKKRFINDTIEKVRANLKALIADAGALSQAAVEGKLHVRADATRHPGDFGRIVAGVNATLDALTAPITELAATLDQLALGELSARTDPSRHGHDARLLLGGVNETLDALLAPVREATQVLGRMAERDLQARMSGAYDGEHAVMKEAVNRTADALQAALAQVAEAVDQVSTASTQIASSAQAVAAGASQQAASLEETGASVEALADLARGTADGAQQASALAASAHAAAAQGADAVEALAQAMQKIAASSEATSQIIKDVSDIAFQTNLLALNAAVEAARAGDAGRGFAVVAEEVRSLALRAKEAAGKTEELIRGSVKQAGEGEHAAAQVAARLGEIGAGVARVSQIVTEIAGSAQEQASSIAQVTTAISEVDKVTQQNAASAEESSSAATELSGQSTALAQMVATFQLGGEARALPPRVATPRALASGRGERGGPARRPSERI